MSLTTNSERKCSAVNQPQLPELFCRVYITNNRLIFITVIVTNLLNGPKSTSTSTSKQNDFSCKSLLISNTSYLCHLLFAEPAPLCVLVLTLHSFTLRCLLKFSYHSLRHAAPRLWNRLPPACPHSFSSCVLACNESSNCNVCCLPSKLKTYLFQQSFPH